LPISYYNWEGADVQLSHSFDVLVIGAGPAGAVAARNLAERGKRILILERREHVAGNAYDRWDEAGVLIHQYGPHIFHTSHKDIYDFLSRFTAWHDYQHRVVANVNGTELPVPFNLTSLELAFGVEKGRSLGVKLLQEYGAEQKITILQLRQSANPELSQVADYVYENVFLHYTMKQWGTTPEQIDPDTTARVPVFLSRDDRYFQDPYQGMPRDGYTALFQAMLDHPGITVELGCDAVQRLTLDGECVLFDGAPFSGPVLYTGAVDELFGCCFGRLPYRTLDFQFETLPQTWYQSRGTVNYTVSEPYTRITEFKHMTGQTLEHVTTIVKEYSRAFTGAAGETPYYAIISPDNNALYRRYQQRCAAFGNLRLLGRLAEYKYYNMDAIVARALEVSGQLVG